MKTSGRTTIAFVMAAVLVLGIAGSAVAGGKGGGGRGTLSLVVLSDPALTVVTEPVTPVAPHYGDDITFEVSTTATDQPFVNVRCYQGDAFVYDGWAGFYQGAWGGQTFTLSSMYWTGGEADCTARLVMWGSNGRERTLSTMDFHVEA